MTLFPPIAPSHSGHLETGDGHSLYWEQCGEAGGMPLIFLHGGPGSGCTPKHRRLFDPRRFKITLFDQRGCGRSRPLFELENNTTRNLLCDIEALRIFFGFERWIVAGASWGSTLALAYAQAYPESVAGLLLEGVFLATDEELAWWHTRPGAPNLFPDAFDTFLAGAPPPCPNTITDFFRSNAKTMRAEIKDGLTALEGLESGEARLADLRRSLLYRWTEYEDQISWMDMAPEETRRSLAERGREYVASHSLIESHYFAHACFLEPGQLLRNASKLNSTPIEIINGRYDLVCPMRAAHLLAKACPHARLTTIPDNGHAMTDRVYPALNAALDRLAKAAP